MLTHNPQDTNNSKIITYAQLQARALQQCERLADAYNRAYPAALPVSRLDVYALMRRYGWRCAVSRICWRDCGGLIVARVNGYIVPVAPAALPTTATNPPAQCTPVVA